MLNPTIEEIIGAGEYVPSEFDAQTAPTVQATYPVAEHWPASGGYAPVAS